ncbi:MAG TPA: polysaccharide deacetylase family protein [Hanamia sp.]|nr:polysaccharide deacetylase family protein [Hanamia sp.]
MQFGKFVISLDFELYWGIKDVVELEKYESQLLAVREVIPKLLDLFEKYQIHATFATVGLLFFETKKQMLQHLPVQKPSYNNFKLSPYFNLGVAVGNNEKEDPFHFGWSLIKKIADAGQEIASHSFSHYYCLEKGQTKEEFIEDVRAAKNIAKLNNIELNTFIFPRNQYNIEYLDICKKMGFIAFRGNENSRLFSSEWHGRSMVFRRPFRLLDSYFNLSGHNCYSEAEMKNSVLVNIPSSRFLRPYNKKFNFLEHLRLRRITSGMEYAAKNRLAYHLWWHPHNFGANLQQNFDFLEKILVYYKKLHKEFNFESVSMQQLAQELTKIPSGKNNQQTNK